MTTRLKLIFSLAIFAATASAHADSLVYVTNLFQQFGTLSLTNGHFTPIGPGLSDAGSGLVPGAGGNLLTLTISGNLSSINPISGMDSIVGATGLGGNANTMAEVGGILYATDLSNNLYSLNSSTGAATLIGSTGIPAVPAYPFTTNPDGTLNLFDETLYGVGNKLIATFDAIRLGTDNYSVSAVISPNLWQIDPITGAATLVTATDLQLLSSVDVNGTFYTLHGGLNASHPFPGFSTIDTLDLTTGKATFIADVDSDAGPIFAMSPVPVAPTPEPSSLALLGTGFVTLAATTRKRWSTRWRKS